MKNLLASIAYISLTVLVLLTFLVLLLIFSDYTKLFISRKLLAVMMVVSFYTFALCAIFLAALQLKHRVDQKEPLDE